MENERLGTPSFTPKPPPEYRGAGGKFRKPPSRRQLSTPYARPPPNQAQHGGGGGRRWLSKLVDPAYRLIVGGANLFLPSFLFKSGSINALPGPTDQDEQNDDNLQAEVQPKQNPTGAVNDDVVQNLESGPTGLAGTSKVADSHSDFDGYEQNQQVQVSDPNGISKIEQLMKDQRLSRDEINRLIEILNSRGVDLPDVEHENECIGTPAGDLGEHARAPEYSGKLTEAKKEDFSSSIWETSKINERKYSSAILIDDGNKANAFENSRKSIEEKNGDLDGGLWKSSTPLSESKLQNNVGASPIEIARAYMENRTLGIGFGTNSLISKDEGKVPRGDELAVKSYIPSPAPKSSPCWPGASVEDQRGYMTPQSQRGRFGLHNFPRTPYSRSIYTKTKSRSIQLQANSDRPPGMISTPFQQIQAPSFGKLNPRGKTLNDGHGSVGPIRRIRHKGVAETPSRGSAYFHSPLNGGQVENFSVSEGLFSAPWTNLENRVTNSSAKVQSIGSKAQSSEVSVLISKPQCSEVSVPTVPAHSSQVAKKILEHLERNPPTPKDKSAELRLATSWKKPESSDVATFMPKKLNRLTRFGGLNSAEKTFEVDKKDSQESANEVNVAVNNNTSTSDIKLATASTLGDYTRPSPDFRKPQDFQFMNVTKDASKVVPNAAGSEVLSFQKLPPQSSSTKPVLPSIAINKSNQRWNFSSSDNSLGFTFPVSAASGVSSEPPTPSIMPSSSAIGQLQQSEGSLSQVQQNDGSSNQLQQNEGSSIPSYSFGTRRTAPPLVFSFPSTSSTPILDDASDVKFKFGSDETTRLSFSSVGKDAICY
ncbi:nuclear pore complex protein NUP1 isoform X2 [Ricinus communis]|uniref:nuclear pore complex protein NUP1 isoform X2 n=1 Tax=Ricinus communis TaxID=3988 RepID=UPI00201A9B6A|nr:nuclear pore complex protein NUP1 isoform X2 [Ricinus communis]